MTVTDRDRRTLRVLVYLILPAFAVAYAVRPMAEAWGEAREDLARQADLLERERAVIAAAGAGALDAAITSAGATLAREERAVIRASSRPTAFSDLADHLRGAARREQVLVQQVSELSVDSLGGDWQVLRLGVRGESDLAGITRFIRAIEDDPRRIRLTRLFIERQRDGGFAGSDVATDGRNVLTVHATVEALARVTSPRGTAP